MGKITNILDLNNRLTKVEKENVAQNSYTSLKNKPKINSVTLTGNKTLADIGAAAAADVGNLNVLNTTDKSSCVGAINELKSGLTSVDNRVSSNKMTGQVVDLTQYTDANPFLIPSDGYVWVYSRTQRSTVFVTDHTYSNSVAIGSLEIDNTMYVKAGMYAYFRASQGATDYIAEYKPLS